MSQRAPPSEVVVLNAWDRLRGAIGVVECALPSQMTEAMKRLVEQRRRFDDLLQCRPVDEDRP